MSDDGILACGREDLNSRTRPRPWAYRFTLLALMAILALALSGVIHAEQGVPAPSASKPRASEDSTLDPVQTSASSGLNWTAVLTRNQPVGGEILSAWDPTSGQGLAVVGPSLTASVSGPVWTWTYQSQVWTNVTGEGPAPTVVIFEGSLVYDVKAASYVLLAMNASPDFGGTSTWTYHNGTWTDESGSVTPQASTISSMVYDSTDGVVLFLGGGRTYQFNGENWTRIQTVFPPILTGYPALLDDPAPGDGYVLLLGPVPWTYSDGVWTNRTGSISPSPFRSLYFPPPVGAYDPKFQSVVALEEFDTGTYLYHAGAWTGVGSASSPAFTTGLGAPSLGYDPVSGSVVAAGSDSLQAPAFTPGVGSNDSLGVWNLSDASLGAPPSVHVTATPDNLDLGGSVTFQVTITGGYGVIFTKLTQDPLTGCEVPWNVTTFTCTPTLSGPAWVFVEVTDQAGRSAFSGVDFNVTGPPPPLTIVGLSPTEVLLIFALPIGGTLGVIFLLIGERRLLPGQRRSARRLVAGCLFFFSVSLLVLAFVTPMTYVAASSYEETVSENLYAGSQYQVACAGAACYEAPTQSYSYGQGLGDLYAAVECLLVVALLFALATATLSWLGVLRRPSPLLLWACAIVAAGLALLGPLSAVLVQPGAYASDAASHGMACAPFGTSSPCTSFAGTATGSGLYTGTTLTWGPAAGWYAVVLAVCLLLAAALLDGPPKGDPKRWHARFGAGSVLFGGMLFAAVYAGWFGQFQIFNASFPGVWPIIFGVPLAGCLALHIDARGGARKRVRGARRVRIVPRRGDNTPGSSPGGVSHLASRLPPAPPYEAPPPPPPAGAPPPP